MRVFKPLPESHPAVRMPCGICNAPLGVGARTVLIPTGPASDDDAIKAKYGRAYTATANAVHFECLSDDQAAQCVDAPEPL